MKTWQMQEAKAKLSEVLKKANKEPQEISIRGKRAAVVLSIDQYTKLTSPKSTFIDFLQQSPLAKIDLEVPRSKAGCRKIELE